MIARDNSGNRLSEVAGLSLALHTAKSEIANLFREKQKAPAREAVALYSFSRICNENEPKIRIHKKAESVARSEMDKIFLPCEQDESYDEHKEQEAYEEYQRLRIKADEHARTCELLQAEIDKASAEMSARAAEAADIDQKIEEAAKHAACIENTLHELIIDMTPTPDEYRGLVSVTVNDHRYARVCIGRSDIPGACLTVDTDGSIPAAAADVFMKQINLLRRRDEQDEMLAAD